MTKRLHPVALVASLLAPVAGCDGGPSSAEQAAAAKAKADKAKADKEAAEAKAARDKRAAEREQQQAAAKAAEDALQTRIDALAVIPDKLPSKLDKACDAMVDAYDQYMRTVLKGDMLTKWETGGNEMQVAVFRKECLKRDIATAACQAGALANATPDLEKSLARIMKACAEKAAAAADSSAPPR